MRSTVIPAVTSALVAAILAGCSSATPTGATAADLEVGETDLSAVCPATVGIQTSWTPGTDNAYIYRLLGPDPMIDSATGTVSGPLYTEGEYAGVDVEIRAGGPAIGYQTVQSQLYTDDDILLGFVPTDNQIATFADQPVVSVMAPLNKSPLMIMWDPATYPDVHSIADLGRTDAVVRYYGDAPFMAYLVESGQLRRDQVDGGYDGAPANFVASGGADAQQGFVTSEPYQYEHEIPEWSKPVAYQMVSDAGYEYYEGTLAVRADRLDARSDCLKSLVPAVQRAEAEFFADPEPTLDLIARATNETSSAVPITVEAARAGIDAAVADGIVADGPDGAIGSFDPARVASTLDVVAPLFEASGTTVADGLVAEDLYTNDFIDPSVGLAP
ncbi:ABC transporter substrate-binding protein [Isoptericola sp. NPDC019482]|uniref:ABC transporter substrate-binding protein n=1 Tax=Isoptericola sp. NPDC019482 TaxID=3154688 RepID=UPI00346AA671